MAGVSRWKRGEGGGGGRRRGCLPRCLRAPTEDDDDRSPSPPQPPQAGKLSIASNSSGSTIADDILAQLLDIAASNPDLLHFQKTLATWVHSHAKCADVSVLLYCREADLFHCSVVGDVELVSPVPIASGPQLTQLLAGKDVVQAQDLPNVVRLSVESVSRGNGALAASVVPIRSKKGLLGALLLFHTSAARAGDEARSVFKYIRLISSLLAIVANVEEQRQLAQQSQIFLAMAQNVFSSIDDMSSLVRNITKEAKTLIQAETCSLFLLDDENGELVAEVFEKNGTDDEYLKEIRLPLSQGIAGHVAQTATLMNVADAYTHPLFYTKVDETTGFHTRNILCFPIKNTKGDVVGVAELCNKLGRPAFSEHDEQIASTFAVYCAISISHCLLYRKLREAHRRTHFASELMTSTAMEVVDEEVMRLEMASMAPLSTIHPNFQTFQFLPRTIGEGEGSDLAQLQAILSMFGDLGFMDRYRIPRKRLSRFLLMVQKGYRQVPYHNWSHAFSVAHFCFLLLKTRRVAESLSPVHHLALFVAALCHDIDHRGTNNAFQVQSKTPLAQLYSSEGSVLERHHFAQTMCILNQDNCNFFDYLPAAEYNEMLDLIREIILASDLAQHLKKVDKIRDMIQNGYDASNREHQTLLIGLLMTASDLSDQSKGWSSSKHIAAKIYTEFFSQGDLEKAMGKEPSSAMMDRSRAVIPRLQLEFLDYVALPVYEMLGSLVEETAEVAAAMKEGRRCWVALDDLVSSGEVLSEPNSVQMLTDPVVEAKVLTALGLPLPFAPAQGLNRRISQPHGHRASTPSRKVSAPPICSTVVDAGETPPSSNPASRKTSKT